MSSAYLWDGAFSDDDHGTSPQDMILQENDYILEQCQSATSQECELIPTFAINPLTSYAIDEINRYYDTFSQSDQQFESIILKLHFSNSNVDITNPTHLQQIKQVFQTINDYKGRVLLHFDNIFIESSNIKFNDYKTRYDYMESFIKECIIPNQYIRVLFAHVSGFGGYDDRTHDLFKALVTIILNDESNTNLRHRVFYDLSSVFFETAPIAEVPAFARDTVIAQEFEELLSKLLQEGLFEQVFWGSDYPFSQIDEYLGMSERLWKECVSALGEERFKQVLSNDLNRFAA